MFEIDHNRIVKWPVHVQVPIDGGTFETKSFTALFRMPPPPNEGEAPTPVGAQRIIDLFIGWEDVTRAGTDGAKLPVPYSDAAKLQLLALPHVGAAVGAAFLECFSGIKRKNLNGPLGIGPAAGTPALETTK